MDANLLQMILNDEIIQKHSKFAKLKHIFKTPPSLGWMYIIYTITKFCLHKRQKLYGFKALFCKDFPATFHDLFIHICSKIEFTFHKLIRLNKLLI